MRHEWVLQYKNENALELSFLLKLSLIVFPVIFWENFLYLEYCVQKTLSKISIRKKEMFYKTIHAKTVLLYSGNFEGIPQTDETAGVFHRKNFCEWGYHNTAMNF